MGQANGPSPQSYAPLPLNWFESNSLIDATWLGGPNEAPPFTDFDNQTSAVGRDMDAYVR